MLEELKYITLLFYLLISCAYMFFEDDRWTARIIVISWMGIVSKLLFS